MPELNEAMMKNDSFWQYKYGAYSANDTLARGSYETDVLVIGAGYTGLSSPSASLVVQLAISPEFMSDWAV